MSTSTPPAAVRPAGGQRMPALYRRLTLVGALALLAGAVLGQLVLGGITLAAAGLGIVATAACNNGRPGWRQPLLFACAAVGVLWTALTGLYWWEISRRVVLIQAHQTTTATDATLGVLLASGAGAVCVMAVLVLLAFLLRARARRRSGQQHQVP